jgi:GT2 family glycosyltransferase
MKDYPLISILSTTYRKFDSLEATISSALMQDYPRIEYIIADDGSENFDNELFNRVVNLYRKSNTENVKIVHNDKNLGTVKNLNNAVKFVKGKYIIPLSMEDIFVNNSVVRNIVDEMEKTDCDILSYSRIQYTSDNQQIRRMPCTDYYKKIKKLDSPKKQYIALITGDYYEMASGSAICIKNSIMKGIGYFDEDYIYWEDGPFLAKCNRKGIMIKTAYDIDGIFYRLGGISSKKSKSLVSIALHKDSIKFYESELKNQFYKKSIFEKRKIQYTIKYGTISKIMNLYFIRILYLDVVIYRFLIKLKNRRIVKKEKKFFKPLNTV